MNYVELIENVCSKIREMWKILDKVSTAVLVVSIGGTFISHATRLLDGLFHEYMVTTQCSEGNCISQIFASMFLPIKITMEDGKTHVENVENIEGLVRAHYMSLAPFMLEEAEYVGYVSMIVDRDIGDIYPKKPIENGVIYYTRVGDSPTRFLNRYSQFLRIIAERRFIVR